MMEAADMDRTRQNRSLKESFSRDVMRLVRTSYEGVVMSSSFGKYSAVTLHLVTSHMPDVPVINIKLGEETPETEEHRNQLQAMLDLDLRIYAEHEGESKAHVFSHALRDVGAKTLISGLMWEETRHREDFEYIMYDEDAGLYRVHPLLHWRGDDLEAYCRLHDLPVNTNYYDPNKEESEKKECGIHVFNYERDGSGI
jgi:phosphoadenosine phosphosulfate reductase